MARIDWVKQRLENWALWHERGAGGGLGFASQSSFLSEADTSRYREAWVPVDEVEAGVTHKAVEALKLGRGHLYETLHLMYLRGTGIKEAARLMGRAESTIKHNLSEADNALALWFNERKRLQEAKAAAIREAMAAARRARGQ